MPAKKTAAKKTATKNTEDAPDAAAVEPQVEEVQPDETEMPNGAGAAAAEVMDDAITVPFRGVDFVIPNRRRSGAKVMMALRLVATDPVSHTHTLLHSLLGKQDSARFLDLLSEDDDIFSVAREFFEAMNTSAGTGNS